MGMSLISTMLVSGVGWTLYHLLRAMRMREMAGLIQIVCWALIILFVIQFVLGVIAWFESTALYRFLERIMGGDVIGGDGGGGGGGGIR